MFYEERIIDGMLMCRTQPNGKWRIKGGSVAIIVNQLLLMSENDREKVFSLFCTHCGSDDNKCPCWNDE